MNISEVTRRLRRTRAFPAIKAAQERMTRRGVTLAAVASGSTASS
jgi:hypothetical protein